MSVSTDSTYNQASSKSNKKSTKSSNLTTNNKHPRHINTKQSTEVKNNAVSGSVSPTNICSFSFDDSSSTLSSAIAAMLPSPVAGAANSSTEGEAKKIECTTSNQTGKETHSSLERMAESCVKSLQLMTFDALPVWMQDNHFILSGYRVNWGWKHSFRSLWKLHNETFNVWTHFLGFVLVTVALVMTMYTISPHGIDHVQWELSTNATCLASASPSAFQAAPPITPWNPNATHVVHHEHDAHNSITDLIEQWSHHIPYMAKVTSSLRDQMIALQDAVSEEKDKFAHLQSEFQQNARKKFHDYVDTLDEEFRSFKQTMVSIQEGTHNVAALNLQAVRAFLSSFSSSITSSKLDVMAFARKIVEDFKNKHDVHSSEGDLHGFSVLPLPVAETSTVHPYLARWPITVFMVSAMACLLFSAVFHLFTSVSEETSLMLQSLDFAGICLLTAGSNVPILYYGFYCAPWIKWSYITVELILGGTGFIITSAPQFRSLKYRKLRAAVFIILGLSGIFPLIHLLFHHGEVLFILWYLLAMGGFYLGGATLYTFHIPERWFPGRFDIFFSSHQLWHVCVFLAVCAHYVGIVEFYTWRMNRVCNGVDQW